MALTLDQLAALAANFGTPLTVIDEREILSRVQAIARACDGRITVRYAMKAGASPWLLSPLRPLGIVIDVGSMSEYRIALALGFPPERLHLYIPGLGRSDISVALKRQSGLTVDSFHQIALLREAVSMIRSNIDLRYTPTARLRENQAWVDGGGETKLGLRQQDIPEALRQLGRWGVVGPGLHLHLGSQIGDTEPYLNALREVLELTRLSPSRFSRVNLGGGMAACYPGESQFDFDALARQSWELLETYPKDIRPDVLTIEPGRAIAAPGAWHVATVTDIKPSGKDGAFLICDARIAAIGLPLKIELMAGKPPRGGPLELSVTGNSCTPHDCFGTIRGCLPRVGDLVFFGMVGAYGLQLEGFLHLRPKAREVAVTVAGDVVERRRAADMDDLLSMAL